MFSSRDKFCQAMHFLVATECFYVVTELVMVKRSYVATELFYFEIECGQRERFSVATGNFMLRHRVPG